MTRTTISWTSLRRYEECHQRHYRVLEGQTNPIQDGRVFLPGQLADRAMRWWLSQDNPQPGQMAEYVPELMRRFTDPQTDEEREDKDRYSVYKWRGNPAQDKAAVVKFALEVVTGLEPLLTHHVLPYEWQSELQFRAPIWVPDLEGRLASVTLIGAWDIVVRLSKDPDRFRLFDLKATSNEDYVSKTLGQATFYDISFGAWIGDEAQPEAFAFLIPAIREKVVWVQIEEQHRMAMMARVIAMAQGMWAEDWRPKESDAGCRWCEARHVCTKWGLDLTTDARGRNRASFEAAAKRRVAT